MASRHKVVHEGGRGLYSAVPMKLARDGSISASARSVALYVWSHDEKWQQSRNEIADALGISVNTAGKALIELERHRWMVREPLGKGAELWHLQVANEPFTPDQILTFNREQLDQKVIQSEGATPDQELIQLPNTGSKTDLVTGSETDPVTGSKIDLHSSRSRSAPEVHDCSSTSPVADWRLENPFADEGERVRYEPVAAGHSGPDEYDPGVDTDMSPRAQAFRAHKPFWESDD